MKDLQHISFEPPFDRFLGRNGEFRSTGVDVVMREDRMVLWPVTSKKERASCYIGVPRKRTAALAEACINGSAALTGKQALDILTALESRVKGVLLDTMKEVLTDEGTEKLIDNPFMLKQNEAVRMLGVTLSCSEYLLIAEYSDTGKVIKRSMDWDKFVLDDLIELLGQIEPLDVAVANTLTEPLCR